MSKNEEMKDRLKKALEMKNKKPSDLAKHLKISRSSISMYLSGDRKIKDSKRLYAIAKYLDVSEPWLMGFDVPMERPIEQKEMDKLGEIIERLRNDKGFRNLVIKLSNMNPSKVESIMNLLDVPEDC